MFKTVLKAEEKSGYVVDTLCPKCIWLHRDKPTTCFAFPKGIPLAILIGDVKHTVPISVEGVSDDGIVFRPRD